MPEAARLIIQRASESSQGVPALVEKLTAFLATHEAENNLPLSIVADIAAGRYPRFELLLAQDGDGRGRSALVWTKPFNLLLCYGDDDAARAALLETLLADGEAPPGATGPEPTAGVVAGWLAERLGLTAKLVMRQGIYRLSRVLPGDRPAGLVRLARPDEADALVAWLEAFRQEADVNLRTGAEMWQMFTESDTRRLWVFEAAGVPVCLTGVGGSTPNGRRIGPVFTPPEHRRRGYAESLVARVSQDLLAAGARFCFLYTDLDYATSNSVYRKVGYEMVAESGEYALVR